VADRSETWWDKEELDRIGQGDGEEPSSSTALPPRWEAWRRTSATGAILTGVALGLQQVFEPQRQEVAIVAPAPTEPLHPTGPVSVQLDAENPSASRILVRAWMMHPTAEVPED
jgi:hypothetical protein